MVDGNCFVLAGVQFCGRVGEWEANADRMAAWAERAHEQKADLIMFPETSLTGYVIGRDRIEATAQTIPGPGTDRLLEIASAWDLAVSAGLSERKGDAFYLSQATAFPDGSLHVYRKRFGGESGYAWGGSVAPFDFRGLRIGIMICLDALVFELYREYALEKTNLVLKPNGDWVGPYQEPGDPESAARAEAHCAGIERGWQHESIIAAKNGMAMMAVNAVGDTGFDTFPGGCWYSSGTAGVAGSIAMSRARNALREDMLIARLDTEALKRLPTQGLLAIELQMANLYYPGRPIPPGREAMNWDEFNARKHQAEQAGAKSLI